MHRNAITLRVGENPHVPVLGRNLRLRHGDSSAGSLHLVEYALHVRVGIEVNQWAVAIRGVVETLGMHQCTAHACLHVLHGEHPHFDVGHIQRGELHGENRFVKCGCPFDVVGWNLEPTDGVCLYHVEKICQVKKYEFERVKLSIFPQLNVSISFANVFLAGRPHTLDDVEGMGRNNAELVRDAPGYMKFQPNSEWAEEALAEQ